ncbi:hypothetical protein DCC81_09720 [Chitinophaga parva]|uniref:SusD/RagB family nutrient-binding outer membrane lipoprotein n=2 Tax=Chitinophaga parva TaxID=2169414 RepID=A0A2T7BPU1_9BACT|nr:hypothetical protein DCC81_09720 [Chitinophaga parva]
MLKKVYMQPTKKIIASLIGVSLLFIACTKDFQGLNVTPGEPTTTTIPPLTNGVIKTLFLKGQEQAAIHNEWYYPATQLGGLSGSSGYLIENGAQDVWNDYYGALQNLKLIQDMINAYSGDKTEMDNVQAITYILRAYKTFRVTDQFGDMPFSEAGRAYTGNTASYRPKYDAQQLIYDSLLTNLAWAAQHINTNANPTTAAGKPYVAIGTGDTFFGGKMDQWLSLCNSLRLRYAIQMVEKDPATATPIIKDVISNNLPVITEGNDVGMWPEKMGGWILNDSRFWAFSSHRFERVSTTVWNLMADGTTDASIFDPRAWLFAETNQAGKWAPYKVGSGVVDNANPYQQNRDADVTDKNGSLYSSFNWYLVRDLYYQPELFMTASEVHFLKAEAYARGLGVGKDATQAQAEYIAGIKSSVNFWYNIAHNTNVTNDNWAAVAPATPTDAQLNTLLANPKVAFTADDAANLKKIYAQEWLSFYREPWLAFNLWRRTGQTPRDGEPAAYTGFSRLTYPASESVNNTDNYNHQVAAMGGDARTTKVWWMK